MSQTTHFNHRNWDVTAVLLNGPDLGGLTLTDVRHAHYSLASDIRAVRVWAGSTSDPASGGPVKAYELGSSQLPNLESIQANYGPTATLFAPYPQLMEISTRYATTGPVVGMDEESQPLSLKQRYIFTDYGTKPAHEPSAVLPAARLYPLVQFAYQGKPNEFKPLNYLRVDYRFAFTIEAALAHKSSGPQDVDHAAVFLDIDVEPSALAGVKGVATLSGIDLVFAAAEKPLPQEMIGQGILHGHRAQWDNIHVWGAQFPLPSTPGAFHAAHFHWRWGSVAAQPTGFPFYGKGGSQFSGVGGAGGPLIDPRIPFQHLRFAITGDVTRQTAGPWKASANGSTRTFDDLFIKESSTPSDISNGAHIVVWVSVEVFRDFENQRTNAPWEGTILPNGLYFAHDAEVIPGSLVALRLKEPLHKPGTAHGWVRP